MSYKEQGTSNEKRLLEAMELVERISASVQTISWIWGGLTIDVYLGNFTRDHHDLDYLTLDLYQHIDSLTGLFEAEGWHTRRLMNEDLQLEKDGVEIQLGNVNLDLEACWAHNGQRGSISFPSDWLMRESIKFCNLEIHVVAPELQYVLLSHPELLNPNWVRREKDTAALEHLNTLLESKGIPGETLAPMVNTDRHQKEFT